MNPKETEQAERDLSLCGSTMRTIPSGHARKWVPSLLEVDDKCPSLQGIEMGGNGWMWSTCSQCAQLRAALALHDLNIQ